MTLTNRGVFQYHNEIEGWKNTGSALYFFNLPQINSFYKKYNRAIAQIAERINTLAEQYFETELVNGQKTIKRDENNKEILIKGLTGESYRKDLDEILNGVCIV